MTAICCCLRIGKTRILEILSILKVLGLLRFPRFQTTVKKAMHIVGVADLCEPGK